MGAIAKGIGFVRQFGAREVGDAANNPLANAMEAELASLQAEIAEAVELLRWVETMDYSDGWTCPMCHRNLVGGHSSDCRLSAFLSKHTTQEKENT